MFVSSLARLLTYITLPLFHLCPSVRALWRRADRVFLASFVRLVGRRVDVLRCAHRLGACIHKKVVLSLLGLDNVDAAG